MSKKHKYMQTDRQACHKYDLKSRFFRHCEELATKQSIYLPVVGLLRSFTPRNDNGHKGFTLAEVLLVITVIGVVASLTIPDLITNVQEQQYKAGFKKAFRNITQASIEIKEDYGSLNNAFSGATSAIQTGNMITVYCDYMQCLKEFGWNQQGNCASIDRYELDGGNVDGSKAGQERPCIILSDGTILNFNWVTGDPLNSWVTVDVNGQKKPNTMGLDVFIIQFEADERVLPAGYQGGYYALNVGNGQCVKNISAWYSGYSCATKVLTNTDY